MSSLCSREPPSCDRHVCAFSDAGAAQASALPCVTNIVAQRLLRLLLIKQELINMILHAEGFSLACTHVKG